MNTLVRTLLVWLVLLAVPFQGFAAAAMSCAHGVAPRAPAQSAEAPCHGATVQASHLEQAGQDEGKPAHQKSCGNCAACSVGTAMAPGALTPPPACCPCSDCPAAAPARIAAVDLDLPERPPRTIPA